MGFKVGSDGRQLLHGPVSPIQVTYSPCGDWRPIRAIQFYQKKRKLFSVVQRNTYLTRLNYGVGGGHGKRGPAAESNLKCSQGPVALPCRKTLGPTFHLHCPVLHLDFVQSYNIRVERRIIGGCCIINYFGAM